jgi:hypothetical protein
MATIDHQHSTDCIVMQRYPIAWEETWATGHDSTAAGNHQHTMDRITPQVGWSQDDKSGRSGWAFGRYIVPFDLSACGAGATFNSGHIDTKTYYNSGGTIACCAYSAFADSNDDYDHTHWVGNCLRNDYPTAPTGAGYHNADYTYTFNQNLDKISGISTFALVWLEGTHDHADSATAKYSAALNFGLDVEVYNWTHMRLTLDYTAGAASSAAPLQLLRSHIIPAFL